MSLPRETEDDSEDVSVTDIEGSDHPPDLRDGKYSDIVTRLYGN